nr:ribonuclease H-like domain-containing protein [Tanacetum cinerariifolium]
MSAIIDVKCALTQKALDALCNKFHILEEFWKFPEAFLCLVGLSCHYTLDEETYPRFLYKNREEMDIFAFIHTLDPTKVKFFKRERNEGEPILLETIIGRTNLLLLVAPDRAKSELDASVERHFDEGGSGNQMEQVDFAGDRKDGDSQPVIEAVDTVVEDLREDNGTPSGIFVCGKSKSALKRLLVGDVLNVKVEVVAMPTLPFMTTSISCTPKCEGGDHIDFATGLNLRAIGAPSRSSVLIMTTVTTITSTVDPASVAYKKLVKPFLFWVDSFLAGETDPTTSVFSDLTGIDFLVGAFFASVRGMKHDQLFTEFNVGATRQMSLIAEVRMRAKYNVKENKRLKSVAERQVELLKVKEGEIENFKAQLLLREAEAAEAIRPSTQASNFEAVEKSFQDETNVLKERNAILEKEWNALDVKVTELELNDLNALITSVKSQNEILVDWVHELEISSLGLQEKVTMYESCMDQVEKFQDDRIKVVNDKFDKLYTEFVKMALHLEEKFYLHLLTTVSRRRWLLTYDIKLAIVKYLNSPEYLSALGAAIGKAIKKGMQDGLSARIVHGKEGRALTDVAAHNPSAKVNYTSALQQLQHVNFFLLAELKSNKDANVEAMMNILHLEGPLAKKLGLNELQPNVDQLMVLIHRSPDKVVLGAITLSLALDVSSFWVRRIRENIANQRSALRDVFVPIVDPLSAAILIGMEGTFNTAPATTNTNTALSTTFASASSIDPISVDDYEVVGAGDQAVGDENVASFPNVYDAELNTPEPELASLFQMACFVAPVDEVSWLETCVANPDIIVFFHHSFALCFLNCFMLSFSSKIFRIIAFFPYVSENGVSSLLDLIIVCVSTCLAAYDSCLPLFFWKNFLREPVRSALLTMHPLPDVKDAYNNVSREESHRGFLSPLVLNDEGKTSLVENGSSPLLRNKTTDNINLYQEEDSVVETHGLTRSSRQTKVPTRFNDFVAYSNAKKPIGCKWLFKIKYKSSRDIERYKARLVTKGFNQREGFNYDETFSLVVKMVTVRCVISIAVKMNWPLYQLDVNNAFLYDDLIKDVYMTLPQGFNNDNGTKSKFDYSLYVKRYGYVFVALLLYVDDIVINGNDE